MISEYKGPFTYSKPNITNWNSNQKGVYYLFNNSNNVVYVGKATGLDGIRGRLLEHLSERKWFDVTDFGYKVISTENEALRHEASEIKRLQPRHNKQGL